MHRAPITLALTLALSGMALAHADTKDPTVRAWMANMKAIAAETKRIGQMVRGQTAFDADASNAALAKIAAHSAEIPTLFKIPAVDPTSEARDLIWSDWDAFEAEARALTEASSGPEVTSEVELRAALGRIAATCKSCHGTYQN